MFYRSLSVCKKTMLHIREYLQTWAWTPRFLRSLHCILICARTSRPTFTLSFHTWFCRNDYKRLSTTPGTPSDCLTITALLRNNASFFAARQSQLFWAGNATRGNSPATAALTRESLTVQEAPVSREAIGWTGPGGTAALVLETQTDSVRNTFSVVEENIWELCLLKRVIINGSALLHWIKTFWHQIRIS